MRFRTHHPKTPAPGHISYLTLKASEKKARAEKSLDFLLHLPSSLKRVLKPSVSSALTIAAGKERPYLRQQRDAKRNPSKQVSLSLLQVSTLASYLRRNLTMFLWDWALFIKPNAKYSDLFLWVIVSL